MFEVVPEGLEPSRDMAAEVAALASESVSLVLAAVDRTWWGWGFNLQLCISFISCFILFKKW